VIDLKLSPLLEEGKETPWDEETLETAIVLSLFTERRDEKEGGGWWGHTYGEFGSRLWTLRREKLLPGLERRAERFAREALAWLVAEGWCAEVRVTGEISRRDDSTENLRGIALLVEILPRDPALAPRAKRFLYPWS
jgi:phage gp46-like protein